MNRFLIKITMLLALFTMAFSTATAQNSAKVESTFKEIMKKYDHVYFIQTNATSPDHETSVDGTHPNDYGYTLWAKSIEKPLLKILKKYGIK